MTHPSTGEYNAHTGKADIPTVLAGAPHWLSVEVMDAHDKATKYPFGLDQITVSFTE